MVVQKNGDSISSKKQRRAPKSLKGVRHRTKLLRQHQKRSAPKTKGRSPHQKRRRSAPKPQASTRRRSKSLRQHQKRSAPKTKGRSSHQKRRRSAPKTKRTKSALKTKKDEVRNPAHSFFLRRLAKNRSSSIGSGNNTSLGLEP